MTSEVDDFIDRNIAHLRQAISDAMRRETAKRVALALARQKARHLFSPGVNVDLLNDNALAAMGFLDEWTTR